MKLASLNRWKASLAHLAISAANRVDGASLAKATSGEFKSLPLTGPKVVGVRQEDRRHGRNSSGVSVVTEAS
jgi:hypothetical protein